MSFPAAAYVSCENFLLLLLHFYTMKMDICYLVYEEVQMTPTKQILVIEDSEINRDILTSILENEYSVLSAENGLVGLNLLKEHSDDISLILLDIEMPVMDGYTFLDTIKADEELSLVPVIVMTSSDTEEGEVEALVRGATDFLPKPYKPQILLHRVANIISLRENAALANQFKYDRLTGL